jgi:hypothetical protein
MRDKAFYDALKREFGTQRKKKPKPPRVPAPNRIADGYWNYRSGKIIPMLKNREWLRWNRWLDLVVKLHESKRPTGAYRMRWGRLTDDAEGVPARLRILFIIHKRDPENWIVNFKIPSPETHSAVRAGLIEWKPTTRKQMMLLRLTPLGRKLISWNG